MTTTQLPGARPAPPARRRGRNGRPVLVGLVLLGLVGSVAAGWAWLRGSVGSIPVREYCTALVGDGMGDLDPEQAGNAAVIASIAVRRGLPARAATIGIATAMQESKLRNIDYGDRDSLGLFQQRPSQGWGTPEQVQDPVYASNAFYDVLVKVEGYQSLPITDAAQKVQRSAYPSAYEQHEPEARALASALSGYSPGAFECVLRPADVAAQEPGANGLTARATALVKAAKTETGRTGKADPEVAATAPEAGTAVRFTLAGREGTRTAWSLAHWAVARADALAVTAVEVDGKQWRRDRPDAGWAALTDGPPAGTVVVHVA
ncbi:hypothetical protein [Kineosporia sp. R_H_3]|uniref:hypothetical protein n=1 Tax=Kineosporia sp. R_H_3 TaxID=1961848 RepID=UPI000B4AB99A|nr:hypothetical protein [Kineosporia sp. R_H_3]